MASELPLLFAVEGVDCIGVMENPIFERNVEWKKS